MAAPVCTEQVTCGLALVGTEATLKEVCAPLAITTQRLSTLTSVLMKTRLRVERTTRGREIRMSPIPRMSGLMISLLKPLTV